MPNLTFFVCSFIAGCSCLAAFMVRQKNNRVVDDTLEDGNLIIEADRNIAEPLPNLLLACPSTQHVVKMRE